MSIVDKELKLIDNTKNLIQNEHRTWIDVQESKEVTQMANKH